MLKFFIIIGIDSKTKTFLDILLKFEAQDDEFKFLSMNEFEEKQLDPEKMQLRLQPEEFCRRLDATKELDIFEISQDKTKVFLTRDKEILAQLNKWKKNQN